MVAEPPVVDTTTSYSSLELLLMVVVSISSGIFHFYEKHLPPIKYITKLLLFMYVQALILQLK